MSATTGTLRDLLALDAVAQADLVNRREITPTELVTASIEQIERLNPVLNAVVTREFDRALEAATTVPAGAALAGVPFLLKDMCVEWEGVRFTEGSAFLRDNVSGHDQELTRRLRRAGVVLLGKTNSRIRAAAHL